MDPTSSSSASSEAGENTQLPEMFRNNNSDVEVVTSPSTRKRAAAAAAAAAKESTEPTSPLDVMSVSKANMSTSRRPTDLSFTQQRMFGWQPILTPYNVLPVLFVLGLSFVILGAVLLTASMGVQEYSVNYTNLYTGTVAGTATFPLDITSAMKGPVYVYYKLTNFYQNNRLYANSYSAPQLKGEFLGADQLKNTCDPLVADASGKVYYPCGLIANSMFSDFFSISPAGESSTIGISSEDIAWPADISQYGALDSKYLSDVVPPPKWTAESAKNMGFELEKVAGTEDKYVYTKLPNLAENERFMNWMKISGLPTFRKLFGRIVDGLPEGKYTVTVKGNFDVSSYKGTKSFIISTTNWAGGKNDALGYGFIIVGGLLLVFGLVFLVMFMMSPRKVGDISYLSWYDENAPEAIEFIQPVEN